MGQTYGVAIRDRYWEIFEKLRSEIGYADYWAPCYQWRRQIVPDGVSVGIRADFTAIKARDELTPLVGDATGSI